MIDPRASAIELAAALRRRTITSEALVRAALDHLERTDRVTHAVTAWRRDAALAEAAAADAQLARDPDDARPLLGVPCTIKGAFAVAGMPWTSGLVARKALIADADGTAVGRLRAAGAIPLALTNSSELCMWYETHNRLHGLTRNPYDPARTVGGSSGGEGATVGAGSVPFGLGADVGGSIRMPAFFCGVFGHKPSGGLVPNSGQFPQLLDAAGGRTLTTGPLARRAEDLMPLLRVLAGPDGVDQGAQPALPLGDPATVDLKSLRVFDLRWPGAIQPALRDAQSRAAAWLSSRGARVEPLVIPALRRAFDLWSGTLATLQPVPYGALLDADRPVRGLRPWIDLLRGRSPHTLPSVALATFEWTGDFPRGRAARLADRTAALRDELDALLGDDGVLLCPSHPRTAPLHGDALRTPFAFTPTGIWNVLWVPSTQVPMGLDARGLPLGVQVIARRGGDHRTIAVAMALEQGFGGWHAPALARQAR